MTILFYRIIGYYESIVIIVIQGKGSYKGDEVTFGYKQAACTPTQSDGCYLFGEEAMSRLVIYISVYFCRRVFHEGKTHAQRACCHQYQH